MIIQRTHDFISNQTITGTVVILGMFVSLFLNVILQVALLVLRVAKKDVPVKAWLRIVNATVFAVQLVYFFLTQGN